jgi:hypothetical protein
LAHDVETTRRDGSVRGGRRCGGDIHAGVGTWGVQMLSVYAGETGEATTFPRLGLFHLCPAAHGDSAMAELGLAFTAAERSKGSRPAVSNGVHLDGGGITRGTLKAPPLPCTCACTKETARQKPQRRGERVNGLGARANGAKGPTFTQRVRVRGCTGTLVGVKARACARRCHGHGGG